MVVVFIMHYYYIELVVCIYAVFANIKCVENKQEQPQLYVLPQYWKQRICNADAML